MLEEALVELGVQVVGIVIGGLVLDYIRQRWF